MRNLFVIGKNFCTQLLAIFSGLVFRLKAFEMIGWQVAFEIKRESEDAKRWQLMNISRSF